VNLAAGATGGIAQPFEIRQIVSSGKETGLTAVSALHDVQGHAIEVDAGATGHRQIISFNASLAPLFDNPVNAFTLGGIVRDAGLGVEQFRDLL